MTLTYLKSLNSAVEAAENDTFGVGFGGSLRFSGRLTVNDVDLRTTTTGDIILCGLRKVGFFTFSPNDVSRLFFFLPNLIDK